MICRLTNALLPVGLTAALALALARLFGGGPSGEAAVMALAALAGLALTHRRRRSR